MRSYSIYGLLPALMFIFGLGLILGLSASAQESAITEAAEYLKTTDPSAWSTMALIAADEEASTEHLKDTEGDKAINYTAPILALTAADKDPRGYPDSDLVQELLTYHQEGQIGELDLLNDSIFAILALAAAGEQDHSAVVETRSFLLDNQLSDGSWGFAVASDGDTNTTAAAVMALVATGSTNEDPAIVEALDYLRQAQNEDGGFPYTPGDSSDAASAAWVMSMINVLEEENLQYWTREENSPRDYLLSLQSEEGYFRHQSDRQENAFTPTETSYVVVALAGYGYPVETESGHDNPESGAPSVRFRILGEEEEICQGAVEAETPLMVIKNAAEQCEYEYEIEQSDFGPYLTSIAGLTASGQTGWLYTVNWQSLDEISEGSADRQLEEQDYVLWLFDEWEQADERIAEDKGGRAEVPLRVELSEEEGEEEEEEKEEEPEISFQVTASDGSEPEFFFTEAERGQQLEETVTLHNEGTAALETAAGVSGHSLFREHLKIAYEPWRQFRDTMKAGESNDIDLSLTVPTDSPGLDSSMEGTLVFWVTAK